MNGSPKKHHYLPQFYLREFSVDRASLFQIVKKSSQVIGGRINKIAAINDFHKIDGNDVPDAYILEKQLATLEGYQATTLRTVLAGGIQNKTLRNEIVQLIAVMRMRVPAVRRHLSRSYESTVVATATQMEKTGKIPRTTLPDGRLLRVSDLKVEVMNWKVMEQMFQLASSESVLSQMYPLRITIFRAPFGDAFITSDQPVSLFHATAVKYGNGVGPGSPGVEICFPLSSRMLIRLDDKPGAEKEEIATSEQVSEFNRRTIISADSYIFAGESAEHIAETTAKFSHLSSGFTFYDVADKKGVGQLHRYVPVGPVGTETHALTDRQILSQIEAAKLAQRDLIKDRGFSQQADLRK